MKMKPEHSCYRILTSELVINVLGDCECVIWELIDTTGNTISTGLLSTQQIKLVDLKPNQFYVVLLNNKAFATITTFLDMKQIKVIDENHMFTRPIKIFGDIRFANEEGRSVLFSDEWKINRTLGNGVIRMDDFFFAYAPRRIFTRNREAPEKIHFTPLAGMDPVEIEVIQIPDIRRIGYLEYSILPASKLLVKFAGKEYKYDEKVKVVDLKTLTADKEGSVEICFIP